MPSRRPKPSPLGQYLKELRAKKDVSLRDVEDATKISNAYLSQLETGARQSQKLPPPDILRRLADYFNVTMLEMLQHTGYLDEHEVKETMEAQIDREYQHAISDPRFKFGTRLTEEPSLDLKRFVVEMYKKTVGKKST